MARTAYWCYVRLQSVGRRGGLAQSLARDLRHTHATVLLRQGVHPRLVQECLGQVSIGVTLDTCSHVTPGKQEVAAAIDAQPRDTRATDAVRTLQSRAHCLTKND